MSERLDFDSMNETDVREIVVRPLIERLGYRHGTEATIHTEKILRYDRAFLGRKNPKKDPPLTRRPQKTSLKTLLNKHILMPVILRSPHPFSW
jgi:hypothetical protein